MRYFLIVTTAFAVAASICAATSTEISSPAASGSAEPFLATDNRGRLLLSWLEPVPKTKRVAVRFARYDGTWSRPKTIAEGDDFFVNWADFPSIAADRNGVLIAHWLQKSGPGTYAYDVRYSISRDGGQSWERPLLLNRDGKKVEHGFASISPRPDGGFHAVWLDGREMSEQAEHSADHGDMSLRYAKISAEGRISGDTMLDPRTCECCATAMATTKNGAVIAYRDRTATEIRDISVVRVSGAKPTRPVPLHNDGWKINGCPVNGPQVDARDQNVAAAWFTAANDQPRAYVSFSSDGRAAFGRPIRVDAGTPMGRVDLLILPDNDALVIWMEALGNAANVSARRVSRSGRLGPVVKLADSSAARSSGFPRAALVGTRAYFAWTEPTTPKRLRVAWADVKAF